MLNGTSSSHDVLLLVAVVLSALVLSALLVGIRRLLEVRWALPVLPDEDQPPAGLGRLVPVGRQVDDECRRGLVALESWLLLHRRSAT
ncbi:MAG: hypothetical protein LC789_17210 [Actinobacteria bacterium]|nr:hypothetical protein [Actinomycetota bacterium]MCA1722535.1 hypothetical protein [Actinomycetota bacterium]